MIKKCLILIFPLFSCLTIFAQTDPFQVDLKLRGEGMLQFGNVKQVTGNVFAGLRIENQVIQTGVNLDYRFTAVEGSTIINDFWNYGFLKPIPEKRVYPLVLVTGGYLKSFAVETIFTAGIGGGINLIRKSKKKFLSINVAAGHFYINRGAEYQVSTGMVNGYIEGCFPLFNEKLSLDWGLYGFSSLDKFEEIGFRNRVGLNVPISPRLDLTISNTFSHMDKVALNQEFYNSQTTFGLQLYL